MILPETKALIDFIKELRPYQKWGEKPEVAWHAVLGDDPAHPEEAITIEEAISAVRRAARTEQWITTDVVWREVQAARAAHKGIDFEVIPAPDADPDDPIAYNEALRALIKNMGDRQREPYPYTPEGIDRQRAMIGQSFKVPRALTAPTERTDGPDRPDEWFAGRAQMSGHSEEFLRRRALANTIPCTHPGCEAPVTRTCHVDGTALQHSPAHVERLVGVGLEAEEVTPTRAELDAWLADTLAREGGQA